MGTTKCQLYSIFLFTKRGAWLSPADMKITYATVSSAPRSCRKTVSTSKGQWNVCASKSEKQYWIRWTYDLLFIYTDIQNYLDTILPVSNNCLIEFSVVIRIWKSFFFAFYLLYINSLDNLQGCTKDLSTVMNFYSRFHDWILWRIIFNRLCV